MKRNTMVVGTLAITALMALAGCATPERTIPAVPEAMVDKAEIPGMTDIRGWGDGYSAAMERSIMEAFKQRKAAGLPIKEINALTVSGGGPDGAFGAGILCGWTAAGNRPVFDAVTGISTGSLIAPFAFLGPEYDKPLRDFYTGITTKDILAQRPLLEAIAHGSFADTAPLKQMLVKAVTPEMLKAVAREHAKGRRLYIGTANLDAQRPVIWDMGAIASSGRPEAIELFRQVMLASASIPVAFPPQYFDVAADGKNCQEMHADGGTITNVFHFGHMLDYNKMRGDLKDVKVDEIPRRTWVIRNGLIRPSYDNVSPRLMSIAGRSVDTLMKGATSGDLYRIYALCKMEGMEFNLTYIPDEHHSVAKETFDKTEMNVLFDLGFQMAKDGKAWSKTPPGVGAPSQPTK